MAQERAWQIATRVAVVVVVALLLVLIATGIALTFRYSPSVTDAYANVGVLEHHSFFTARRAHQIASKLFVLAAGVLAFASIGLFVIRRRRASIAIPLLVGGTALVASFTGFLLPWDQLSLWAVTVGTRMRGYTMILNGDRKVNYVLFGSRTMSAPTVGRWYWIHAVVVPLVIIALLGLLVAATWRRSKIRGAGEG